MHRFSVAALFGISAAFLAVSAAAQSPELQQRILAPQPFQTTGKTADKVTKVIDARIVYAYRVCIDQGAGRALVVACLTREPSNLNPFCHVKQKTRLLPGQCRDVAGWRITIEPDEAGGATAGYYRYLGR